jgi:hypothetical protein
MTKEISLLQLPNALLGFKSRIYGAIIIAQRNDGANVIFAN